MRAALLLGLVWVGCATAPVEDAAPQGDASVGTHADADGSTSSGSADAGDASDAGSAADAPDASDTLDASDAGGAADAGDASDTPDASDAGGAADAGDASGTPDASDASDAGSAADASDASDTPDASDASDAGSAADASGASDAGSAADASGDASVPDLRVLFIGNSYTADHDLPKELAALAATPGTSPRIVTQMIAVGGASLADHWNGSSAQAAIASGAFSHVVFQGYSVEPLTQPAVFEDYALRFGGAATDAGAVPVYFETWARVAGDAVYNQPWSGGSPAAMQNGIFAEYKKAAATCKGLLVKVGEAWRITLRDHPSIVLHDTDGSHPTAAGTLLAVYTFYTTLTKHDVPKTAAVPLGVPPAEASALRDVADAIAR